MRPVALRCRLKPDWLLDELPPYDDEPEELGLVELELGEELELPLLLEGSVLAPPLELDELCA